MPTGFYHYQYVSKVPLIGESSHLNKTVGIACFVVYVLFGIRPTIKAYRWSKRRLSRKTGDIEIMGSDSEEEFGM